MSCYLRWQIAICSLICVLLILLLFTYRRRLCSVCWYWYIVYFRIYCFYALLFLASPLMQKEFILSLATVCPIGHVFVSEFLLDLSILLQIFSSCLFLSIPYLAQFSSNAFNEMTWVNAWKNTNPSANEFIDLVCVCVCVYTLRSAAQNHWYGKLLGIASIDFHQFPQEIFLVHYPF